MAIGLPPAANLATAPRGRRLRHLAAGVGIDLGVEHQDVDVAARCEHVIEPAVADVVGPAVAADDPDALLDQVVGHAQQVPGVSGWLSRSELLLERRDALALIVDPGLVRLVGIQEPVDQLVADLRREPAPPVPAPVRCACRCVSRKPKPNSALSSNRELFQLGPRPSLL